MNHDHDVQPGQTNAPPFWRSRYGLGLVVFGAVAAYFLLSEHRAHFLGALPYLLLLACPLMHVFMHHGHGGHGRHHGPGKTKSGPEQPAQPNQGDPS
ncbi:DUF2933 domain-containing protein [Polaromonas hydrogenivorans]|uniref:DUF2933 domain-containing protein n=1 Tax=Polaromonas hydrogenivorans TaxID=335476 RepID=A0AAU7LNC6_9BURK